MHTEEITDNGYERTHNPAPPQSDFTAAIAEAVRANFSADQKMAMMLLAESILEKVIETEVKDVVGPRFEALYEGVIASVMQKLLLQALTQRASETLKTLVDREA